VGVAAVAACGVIGRDYVLFRDASLVEDGGVPTGNGGAPSGRDAAASSGGGSSLPFGAVSCGDATCLPGTSSVQSSACCTDSNECGLRTVLSSKCLSKNERGGVDNRCAPLEIHGMITLPGCCSPAGCGAYATFDQIGCIPNPDLGLDEVPCTPDVPFD
jgi:hypothetical protein